MTMLLLILTLIILLPSNNVKTGCLSNNRIYRQGRYLQTLIGQDIF